MAMQYKPQCKTTKRHITNAITKDFTRLQLHAVGTDNTGMQKI